MAYAAYNRDLDWVPLSSIRATPDAVEEWITKTYVSGNARKKLKIIKVSVRRLSE
jgi:hypothetical protein